MMDATISFYYVHFSLPIQSTLFLLMLFQLFHLTCSIPVKKFHFLFSFCCTVRKTEFFSPKQFSHTTITETVFRTIQNWCDRKHTHTHTYISHQTIDIKRSLKPFFFRIFCFVSLQLHFCYYL